MKKSLNAWTVDPASDFAQTFAAVAGAGFAAIELNLDAPGASRHALSFATTDDELAQIAALAVRHNLPVTSISTSLYAGKLGSPDPADQDRAKAVLRRQLQLARALNAGAILVVPGGPYGTSLSTYRQNTLKLLRELTPEIEASGVQVGLENVWNGFFLSPFDMVSLLDELATPSIGAYFDVGNVLAFSWPESWIEALGSRIVRIHVKDFKRLTGINRGGDFVDLTEGDANWPAIVTALKNTGYEGPLTAEVFRTDSGPDYPEYYRLVSGQLDSILTGI